MSPAPVITSTNASSSSEALPRVVQLRVHGPVDRVALVRSVVGERHDVFVLLVEQRFVVHARDTSSRVSEQALREHYDATNRRDFPAAMSYYDEAVVLVSFAEWFAPAAGA